jgi:hypothetical protein
MRERERERGSEKEKAHELWREGRERGKSRREHMPARQGVQQPALRAEAQFVK